jgi:hypothetical protein
MVWIRSATPSKAQTEALTNVERVRCFSNELRAEPAKKRQHLFPHRIDERDFREIDDKCHSVTAACQEGASVMGVIADESAFKLESHTIRRIVYLDAQHHTSTEYPSRQKRRLESFLVKI